jgi:hypothetical protein
MRMPLNGPERSLLVCAGKRATYAELDQLMDGVATARQGEGLPAGIATMAERRSGDERRSAG